MTTALPPAQAERLKQELIWMGFGTPAAGIFLHPDMDTTEVRALLHDQDLAGQVTMMHASADARSEPAARHKLVRDAWNLSALETGYSDFLRLFMPVMTSIRQDGPLGNRDAFVVRTLLIHEFRRVTLRDPSLPPAVLGQDWPGEVARKLSAELYRAVHDAATRHAMAVLQTADGGLPPPRATYYDRYGGLGRGDAA